MLAVFAAILLSPALMAQTAAPAASPKPATADAPKRQIFRANKDQIMKAQAMMKAGKMYAGEETGKLDDDTRASLKTYQKQNGLKATGTLNRATLETMKIELTDKQKLIPASPNSYVSAGTEAQMAGSSSETKPKRTIFRATKDQIMQAQRMMKTKSMYSGEETGKLDDDTRAGLKKFQEASSIKVTGTLNQITLEKMGIALTDAQKAASASH